MKVNGTRAVMAVRAALAEAGLGRTSPYSGAAVAGWIPGNHLGSTGFSVRKNADGSLGWHVVISGKPHLSYRRWTEHGDGGDSTELHEPVDPERLCPRIEAAFETLGIDVKEVRYGGAQMMWDDDVEYDIVTAHPDWLGPSDPSNRPQAGDGPMLRAMSFSPRIEHAVPRGGGAFVGYVRDGSSYLTRESLDRLSELGRTAEARRLAVVESYARTSSPLSRELRFKGTDLSFEADDTLVMVSGHFADTRIVPETIVNHWGDEVKVWKMPRGWMVESPDFAPSVPFVVDGETLTSVPFKVLDAQNGGEAPWLELASRPAPR